MVVSRSKAEIEKTASELQSETGRKVLGLECDVTNKVSIENAVKQHLEQNNIDYRVIVNILPPNGPGHMNIENAEQAVAYAFGVKNVADELRSQDIQEIFLFLNCPFSVAVFVGHYLTVMCPIHILILLTLVMYLHVEYKYILVPNFFYMVIFSGSRLSFYHFYQVPRQTQQNQQNWFTTFLSPDKGVLGYNCKWHTIYLILA